MSIIKSRNFIYKFMKCTKGFTLIEVLVVMGILALLATVVLVAINPARQFAQSRNTQRTSNVTAILNAVGQRAVDNRGILEGAAGSDCPAPIPATTTVIKFGAGGFDLYPCIVPTYISLLPIDPESGSFVSVTEYDSGYTIFKDTATGRITISAPQTELGLPVISITR